MDVENVLLNEANQIDGEGSSRLLDLSSSCGYYVCKSLWIYSQSLEILYQLDI